VQQDSGKTKERQKALLELIEPIPRSNKVAHVGAISIWRNFVETFRRFALAQLGVSLAWCAAANVSTTRKKKGGYISGFGIIG
jgi:hypothetical protein